MSGLGRFFTWCWIDVIDFCCWIGLISGSAIALASSKLLLAVVLGAFAVGAWLRFTRGRVARTRQAP